MCTIQGLSQQAVKWLYIDSWKQSRIYGPSLATLAKPPWNLYRPLILVYVAPSLWSLIDSIVSGWKDSSSLSQYGISQVGLWVISICVVAIKRVGGSCLLSHDLLHAAVVEHQFTSCSCITMTLLWVYGMQTYKCVSRFEKSHTNA